MSAFGFNTFPAPWVNHLREMMYGICQRSNLLSIRTGGIWLCSRNISSFRRWKPLLAWLLSLVIASYIQQSSLHCRWKDTPNSFSVHLKNGHLINRNVVIGSYQPSQQLLRSTLNNSWCSRVCSFVSWNCFIRYSLVVDKWKYLANFFVSETFLWGKSRRNSCSIISTCLTIKKKKTRPIFCITFRTVV